MDSKDIMDSILNLSKIISKTIYNNKRDQSIEGKTMAIGQSPPASLVHNYLQDVAIF